ncbi:hypothetical protein [Alkalibacillus silvisoli]|uniref:IDEAL domain-containing protein n=1 Tax=Alkalibacillus silvisoli TaxID=392823 RepID=A0ABN1AAR7_9BACI
MNEQLQKLVIYAERKVGRKLLSHEVNILNWILTFESDDREDKLKLLDLFVRTHS